MQDECIGTLGAENVEKFAVWIFDSQELVVSVVLHQGPQRAMNEEHQLRKQWN